MKQVGMITIGQAPRTDVAPIMETCLRGRGELVQVGVLDGFTKEQVDQFFYPDEHDYLLTSRMRDGEQVMLSREKITPVVQKKINQLEEQGIRLILLLCTGVFPGLETKQAYLMEPDQIIPPVLKALVGPRRLGVVVPLADQQEDLQEKFVPVGLQPVLAVASPYQQDDAQYEQAARQLRDHVDVILLDCMGYTEEARKRMEKLTDLPVILSNSLMAKLISEII